MRTAVSQVTEYVRRSTLPKKLLAGVSSKAG